MEALRKSQNCMGIGGLHEFSMCFVVLLGEMLSAFIVESGKV